LQNKTSKAIFERLPIYLDYLKKAKDTVHISATTLARELKLGDVQVRKDLALIGNGGKPKIGHLVSELITAIEEYMGYNNQTKAVIVGMGKLGKAIYNYQGFKEYGIEIVEAFDKFPSEVAKDLSSFSDYVMKENIEVGIITVPKEAAQAISELMVKCKIKAIWNFAPIRLNVPEYVVVQNENIATSLSILVKTLKDNT
jgi:redox-sensing transcriptional repressor